MVCEFTPASCPFDGCYQVMGRKQLDGHKIICPRQFLTCAECEMKYDQKKVRLCIFSNEHFYNPDKLCPW